MRRLRILLVVLALFFATASAFAQASSAGSGQEIKDQKKLEHQAQRLNQEASAAGGEDRVLARMSDDLGIPVDTLKQQKKDTNLSFGDLFIANALAKATGKSFSDIVAEFKSGKGWGQIAKENNVRLGEVVSQLKRDTHAVEAARRNEERRASQARGASGATAQGGRSSTGAPGASARGAAASAGRGRRP